MDELVACVDDALGPDGALSRVIPGFVARTSQLELAAAIAQTIEQSSTLVAEAGTGTGKTFAYLIPCLLSGKKTLISTASKTLQDQLFQKDLPLLLNVLGIPVAVHNLKGRANYICRYRVEVHAEQGSFTHANSAKEIQYVRQKLPQLISGERSELPDIADDSDVWPFVTSTADNCLGRECALYDSCFLVESRKRALDAQLVVINHHLYFADSCLKEEGFGELLPGFECVVFDEAHQLEDIASHFNGQSLSTRQLNDWMNDTLREWPLLDLANQPLKQLKQSLDGVIDKLLIAITGTQERFSYQEIFSNRAFLVAWAELKGLIQSFNDCLSSANIDGYPGLVRCKHRLLDLTQLFELFNQDKIDSIRWLERFKHTIVFHNTPYENSEFFRLLRSRQTVATIFTSATLTILSSFDCFNQALGLTNPTTLLLPSPFDFLTQAILYLPRDLPDPNDLNYYEALLAKAIPIINACQGRCFFLFTSHRALRLVAKALATKINYPVLVQGDEAKPILLARFRQLGNAVLLGTATFWEGVDVKGEALSCVIIDKLPFLNPSDPIIRGKIAYLKTRGLSGFEALSLPNAVLALKQGVGRLIRDVTDCGVLMLADPRLTAREYGRVILGSLPTMQKTREEETVLSFIKKMRSQDEVISD